jgi:hypothetical protein
MTKAFRCTASALVIRALPSGDDTGARIIRNQIVIAHGVSYTGDWAYVVAPAGQGWASTAHLTEVAGIIEPSVHSGWPIIPRGINAIRATFGDPTSLIQPDGSVDPAWATRVQAGRVKLPEALPLAWKPSQRTTGIACHPLIAAPLQSAFDQIHARGYWHLLEDYGGCYNWRNARGLAKLSTHCWAISIDINVATNGLGAKPTLAPAIVAIFEDHGFVWGGRWSRPDGMHFQFAAGY